MGIILKGSWWDSVLTLPLWLLGQLQGRVLILVRRLRMGVLGGPDPTDGVVGSEQERSAPVGHPWGPYLLSSVQHPTEAGRPSGQAASSCMSQPVLPALLPRHTQRAPPSYQGEAQT